MKKSIAEVLAEMESAHANRPADNTSAGEPASAVAADPATTLGGGDAHANRPADQSGNGEVSDRPQGSSVPPSGTATPMDPNGIPAPTGPVDVNQKWDELMSLMMSFKPMNESEYSIKFNKNDFGSLFESEGISSEFGDKALTIFESAVNSRIKSEIVRINETANSYFTEQAKELEARIVSENDERIDAYLNYVVEQWVKDNQIAIESGFKVSIAENVLTGIKALFTENFVEIPETKADLVEELVGKVTSYEAALAEAIKTNNDLKKNLAESTKANVISGFVQGMTAVKADKIKSLAESVEFTNSSEFITKLKTLSENYSDKKSTKSGDSGLIVEDNGKVVVENAPAFTNSEIPEMARFVQATQMYSPKK